MRKTAIVSLLGRRKNELRSCSERVALRLVLQMSDKGWCYVCNAWVCKEEKEKEMICLSCKHLGTTCPSCLRALNLKQRELLNATIDLLESIISHKSCKDCCGLKLPSLGQYRSIEALLQKIYGR
jgi:hypothetical protein